MERHGADSAGGKDLPGREEEIGAAGEPALTIGNIRRESQGAEHEPHGLRRKGKKEEFTAYVRQRYSYQAIGPILDRVYDEVTAKLQKCSSPPPSPSRGRDEVREKGDILC